MFPPLFPQFAHFSYPAILAVLCCTTTYAFFRFLRPAVPTPPLPPGPRPLPLLGNILDVPLTRQWLVYSQWAKRYGQINSFNVFGQTVVVINSLDVAREILDNRSAIYSDRPRLVMGGELCGWDRTTVLTPYGPRLKEHRSFFARGISAKRSVEKYHPLMEEAAQNFARGLASCSDDLIGQIQLSVASLLLAVVYGYTVQGPQDPIVRGIEETIGYFCTTIEPGAYLVDAFPFLRHLPEWLPGVGFKRTAKRWYAMVTDVSETPFKYAQGTKTDAVQKCVVAEALEERGTLPGADETIRWSSYTLYSAGIDTTTSILASFFLAMIVFPGVCERARQELSQTLGDGVLPTSGDCSRLSYLNAVIKETIRWGVVGPLGVPHAAVEDDLYNGYLIPKGAMVLANVWNICNDPTVYSNPSQFHPERFMGSAPEPDPDYMFGFGRRKCPGMNLALQYLPVACATSLVMLDISKVTDDSGAILEPTCEMTDTVINSPKPFPCRIRRRR